LSPVYNIKDVYLCVAPKHLIYNEVRTNPSFTRLTEEELTLSGIDSKYIGIIINVNFPKHFRQFAEFTKTLGNIIDMTYGAYEYLRIKANIIVLKYDKDPRGYMESLFYDVLWFLPQKFANNSTYGTFGAKQFKMLEHINELFADASELVYGKRPDEAILSQEILDYFAPNPKR
jgi:hypothetical protein